ncbi:efflux RND transporter periplasmic adaptor subunit [Martelella alba]|uniref:Efflux RND transporter periplasmic adaptor subunit n=1 Tax=Martelella alba TaxID=2590451 RepID=A0ABY2SQE0_9HYPH|nr:efflux RND transporter periplasmic adaptor subunit [Martelella alba]TKI06106.1 efflux RND transporter periplasmic adaptor subunit [Martelella alba]
MKRRTGMLGVLLTLFCLISAAVYFRHHGRSPEKTSPQAIPVSVVGVKLADVPVYLNALGTVTPVRKVAVVPQISGILDTVDFHDGQAVRRGQIIAHLDSRALQAQLDQAEGVLAHDRAALDNARRDLSRYRPLVKTGLVARQTFDTQQATVSEQAATVQADQGNVAYLKVQLDYCTIRSPEDGIIGLHLIDPGNYVTPDSAAPIAVVTRMRPATVIFTIAEDDIAQVSRALASGRLAVRAYDHDMTTLLGVTGKAALDNQIDTTTGAVKMQAIFDDAGGALFPNQFVNVRVYTDTLKDVAVVPTRAIQHGARGDFLFIAGADGKARLRNVITGPADKDVTAILDHGVKAGEEVVTDGADKLDQGSAIRFAAKPVNAAP